MKRFRKHLQLVESKALPAIRRAACLMALFLAAPFLARAGSNSFDLIGPRIEMKVTRAGKPLPVSEVANLQPGDRIWLHPDFPDDQSAHYLLIVAFLRGATNPPPDNWFIKKETWSRQMREEGVVVTVPKDAQQALVFLAPETGGDFSTLRNAVRGRPGVFVRASQDLNQANLDRSRLEKYLSEVRSVSDADPKALHKHSTLLARTLGIHLEEQCFDKPIEEQSACLTKNTDTLVLDDGHSQSVVTALASGPNSDLAGAVSATPIFGGGFYSAYVGAVVDLARVLGNLHTASYVYIPALALPKGEDMNLRLNNPPSFRKPMSVIVVALPAVRPPQLPPLRAVNDKQVFCIQKSSLVLPVEGAPLVFSSDIAHDFFLRVKDKQGKDLELPAHADAVSGGFVIDTHQIEKARLDNLVTGTLHGLWGFEPYEGPTFRLRASHHTDWSSPASEHSALIVGRGDTFHLHSDSAVCVDNVEVQNADGRPVKTTWKNTKLDELELTASLEDQPAGSVKVKIRQFGLDKADEVSLRAYSEAAHLENFTIHAGDEQGILEGTRLDEVDHFDLGGVRFLPVKLTRVDEKDELLLAAPEEDATRLQPAQSLTAQVVLKDGRTLDLPSRIDPPRPIVTLVSKNIQPGDNSSPISLGSQDELPAGGEIHFLLKSDIPDKFPRSERIEVATASESFTAFLSEADGSLLLLDSRTVLASFNPRKAFGPSAFGALRFRAIQADGAKGDWQPLATLVRVPQLQALRCPKSADEPCQLSGANLFLIDSVASDEQFTHTAPVPADFIDTKLNVPHPAESNLYFKLRDDPSATNVVALPVLQE